MTLTDQLYQYCDEILTGKIVACQKHQWACLRFIRDLEKTHKREWEWVFVEDRANRYFDWMRLFKHSKGPLAGQYKEPV
ncbi:MAG TPA: terminase large subunit, partial [Firmicutes bacterium]|nr:terminase large subunit [Bacillota bacterium]